MPIDTVDKRRSVSGYTNFPVYPVADAVIGAADREHTAWLYSGIAAGTPAPTTSGNICGDLDLVVTPIGLVSLNRVLGSLTSPITVGSVSATVKPIGTVQVIVTSGLVQKCED